MADVPLGMFLSGGLDSSAIAALMARMIDRPLQTFSVAFKDRAFSELDYARQVATAIKADAHEIVIDDQDFFGALPRLIWHEDEPIAHPSSVPLYFVSALAREHVKVVLTGEGSDELLAGYGKYPRALANWRAAAAYGAVPAPLRAWIADTRRAPPAVAPRPVCAALVPGDAADARGDVLRQLRGDRPAASGLAALAGVRRAGDRASAPTARRARISTRRTGTARRSIACSTPISRRISSSC